MIYAYCLDRKSENGNITEYKLKDFEGNVSIIKSEKLKGLISDGVLCVVNLTLSVDNKLRPHTLATLNDLNTSYRSDKRDFESDIKNMTEMLPTWEKSEKVTKEASFRSVHFFRTDTNDYKIFYVTKDGKLKVYNGLESKEIGSANRKYLDSNIICIQKDNYYSIIINYETTFKKRNYVGLEHILYDANLESFTATEIYDKRYANMGMYITRQFNFDFNVNNVIPLFEKYDVPKLGEKLHPLFLLYNKNKSCFYLVDAPSKGAVIEFLCKAENWSKHNEVFDVTVQAGFGVDLSIGPYTISIDKKSKSGRLSKDI